MNDYNHLNEDTTKIIHHSYRDMLEWIQKDHFIFHDQAKLILSELERVYNQASPHFQFHPMDQNSIGISGPSGTGKTMVIRKFIELHLEPPNPSIKRYKISYSLLRDAITGLGGLYSSILAGFGHPLGDYNIVRERNIRIANLEDSLLYLLTNGDTRVFIIDEFQHARSNDIKKQKSFLNQLKRTMLACKVPFIPVGTYDMINVLAVDDQLPDRCPITESTILDYWSYGKQFKKFLEAYEKFLPFTEPSGLASQKLSKKIFTRVRYPDPDEIEKPLLKPLYTSEKANKANLRNIVKYIKKVASVALYQELNCITEEVINAVK